MESTAVNIFIAMDSISRSVDFLPTSGIFGENFLLKLGLLLGPINNLGLQKNCKLPLQVMTVKIVGAEKKKRESKIGNQMPPLGLNIIGSFIRFQPIPLVL